MRGATDVFFCKEGEAHSAMRAVGERRVIGRLQRVSASFSGTLFIFISDLSDRKICLARQFINTVLYTL